MTRYLAVGAVQAEGRPLPFEDPGGAPPAPPEGMCVVAVVHNGAWQVAMDVTHPSMLQRLLQRRREGVWRELRFFTMAPERAEQIEDARRVLMNGQPVQDPGRRL